MGRLLERLFGSGNNQGHGCNIVENIRNRHDGAQHQPSHFDDCQTTSCNTAQNFRKVCMNGVGPVDLRGTTSMGGAIVSQPASIVSSFNATHPSASTTATSSISSSAATPAMPGPDLDTTGMVALESGVKARLNVDGTIEAVVPLSASETKAQYSFSFKEGGLGRRGDLSGSTIVADIGGIKIHEASANSGQMNITAKANVDHIEIQLKDGKKVTISREMISKASSSGSAGGAAAAATTAAGGTSAPDTTPPLSTAPASGGAGTAADAGAAGTVIPALPLTLPPSSSSALPSASGITLPDGGLPAPDSLPEIPSATAPAPAGTTEPKPAAEPANTLATLEPTPTVDPATSSGSGAKLAPSGSLVQPPTLDDPANTAPVDGPAGSVSSPSIPMPDTATAAEPPAASGTTSSLSLPDLGDALPAIDAASPDSSDNPEPSADVSTPAALLFNIPSTPAPSPQALPSADAQPPTDVTPAADSQPAPATSEPTPTKEPSITNPTDYAATRDRQYREAVDANLRLYDPNNLPLPEVSQELSEPLNDCYAYALQYNLSLEAAAYQTWNTQVLELLGYTFTSTLLENNQPPVLEATRQLLSDELLSGATEGLRQLYPHETYPVARDWFQIEGRSQSYNLNDKLEREASPWHPPPPHKAPDAE